MGIDKIIISIVGALGIVFVYWFFLMKKDKIVEAESSINIRVNGGYSPSTISVKNKKTTTLNFTRSDPSTCLEEVVLPDFKIRKFLPLNKTVSIDVTPNKPGTYEIVCGMNMFHGKLIVS